MNPTKSTLDEDEDSVRSTLTIIHGTGQIHFE